MAFDIDLYQRHNNGGEPREKPSPKHQARMDFALRTGGLVVRMFWVGIAVVVFAVGATLIWLADEPIRPPVTPDRTGGRLLGIAITSGEESRYEEALHAALRTGIQVGSAKLSWGKSAPQLGASPPARILDGRRMQDFPNEGANRIVLLAGQRKCP